MERVCDLIAAAFSIDELRTLTRFRLGFELERTVNVKGGDVTVFGLVEYTERRGITRVLLGACISMRPGKEDLVTGLGQILAAELGGAIQATDLLVDQVASKIRQVGDLSGSPVIREAIGEVEDKLRELKRKIDLMRAYKSLHDGLHMLQLGHLRFSKAVRGLDQDPGLIADLQESAIAMGSLQAQVAARIEELPEDLRGRENEWVEELGKAVALAEQQIDTGDFRKGRQSLVMVDGILRREAPRINERIGSACKDLEVESLRELFLKTAGLEGLPQPEKEAFLAARDAAAGIVAEIAALVGRHDRWQRIDGDLWYMVSIVLKDGGSDLADFDASYLNVEDAMRPLIAAEGGNSTWSVKLPALRNEVEASRKVQDWQQLRIKFDAFRFAALRGFVGVDLTLKNLATRVAKIGDSLEELVH